MSDHTNTKLQIISSKRNQDGNKVSNLDEWQVYALELLRKTSAVAKWSTTIVKNILYMY